MAKKPKKASAGPGAARQRASAAQSRQRPRGDFGLAALREITSSHAFTMKDEARNTGHRSSLWGGSTRLRTMPVGFVSAGFIEPLKDEPTSDQTTAERLSEPEISTEVAIAQLAIEGEDVAAEDLDQPLELVSPAPPTPSPPATTTASARSASVIVPAPAPSDPGPREHAQSDVGGFVIDVVGDKSLKANLQMAPPLVPDPQSCAEESDSSTEVILFKGRNNAAPGKRPLAQERVDPVTTLDTIHYEIKTVQAEVEEDFATSPYRAVLSEDRPRRRTKHGKAREEPDDEEAAIIADYIANMAEDSDGSDDQENRQPFLTADLGANDGDLGNETSESDQSADDSTASDEDEDDAVDDDESDSDDVASPTMDDETLARLLAKQEELGMGGDELLLASAAAGGRGSAYYHNGARNSRRGKAATSRNERRGFSSAGAVADAFDDLDLMDWERPSLQKQRKRGRLGQPPVFGLSDSEMEQHLQTAWQKDRESKRSRKIHREELRAQGLLGKHANPDDPRLRYPTGMTLDDIKAEMRSFLEGSESRVELPPMDKSARATLHELARKFKVKSQSTGSGHQRRPTLIRTKYTASYVEERLDFAISAVSRKHFPRLDQKGKGKSTPRKARAGGGNSAVTYQEGEIVGASAPELGQENKGRTMLEKMGWSTGMGLGSLDNKGILQPVAHVVKRTKAGLG